MAVSEGDSVFPQVNAAGIAFELCRKWSNHRNTHFHQLFSCASVLNELLLSRVELPPLKLFAAFLCSCRLPVLPFVRLYVLSPASGLQHTRSTAHLHYTLRVGIH